MLNNGHPEKRLLRHEERGRRGVGRRAKGSSCAWLLFLGEASIVLDSAAVIPNLSVLPTLDHSLPVSAMDC